MRSLDLTLVIFCQILLASLVLYSALGSSLAIPIDKTSPKASSQATGLKSSPAAAPAAPKSPVKSFVDSHPAPVQQLKKTGKNVDIEVAAPKKPSTDNGSVSAPMAVVEPKHGQVPAVHQSVEPAKALEQPPVIVSHEKLQQLAAHQAAHQSAAVPTNVQVHRPALPVHVPAVPVAKPPTQPIEVPVVHELAAPAAPVQESHAGSIEPRKDMVVALVAPAPVLLAPEQVQVIRPPVKGGQGPLHMLAETLCNFSPERPIADEALNQLYSQRAQIRKSLFDFMSLKFTNLEKISSRLNSGIAVMPPKPASDPSSQFNGAQPSHGWPLVGKCTAHDLRLMAEAAWCECADDLNCDSPSKKPTAAVHHVITPEAVPAKATSLLKDADFVSNSGAPASLPRNQRSLTVEADAGGAAAAAAVPVAPVSAEVPVENFRGLGAASKEPAIAGPPRYAQDSAAGKQESLDHTYYLAGLNLTEHQLSVIQAQAGLTQECKRNSLRFTKALFNHLAEDQGQVSEAWPKLYSQLLEDECARKRMIDVVTALSSFRTESTSIRRDNLEFAFAMDDLRSKVLGTEVNTPLQFDKQFIEVEQFLQQSVKLMLANIDPERAKLTSMRYKSLMPLTADDQCVQLHQLLLAKSHPTDCNPNQYGQLTDVLRMTAHSLSLWSIENEIAKLSYKYPDHSTTAIPVENMNQCISLLVSS